MPDDLMPPAAGDNTPAPVAVTPPPAPVRRSLIQCGFCDCSLDPHGNILERGERAGRYVDMADQLKRAKETLDRTVSENTELKAQLEAARNRPRGFLD